MPAVTESLTAITVITFAAVFMVLAWIVMKSRGNKPLHLRFKGLGVEFSLTPVDIEDDHNVDENQSERG